MSEENINEREAFYASGWLILVLWLLALGSMIVLFVGRVMHGAEPPLGVFLGVAVLFFLTKGFVILPPNIAGVLTFWLAESAEINPLITAALVGVSGHMGSRAIYLLEAWAEAKFGNRAAS